MGQVASGLCPIFVNNTEFFVERSNIIRIPYNTSEWTSPASINTTTFSGYDWTKPFPGVAIAGHAAHLHVRHDVPIPETIVQNSTMSISSLSFSIPASMTGSFLTYKMDPSWYICRHIFLSTKQNAREAVAEGRNCSFLGEPCRVDLIKSLTQDWGRADNSTMCSSLAFDPIPASCWDSFGYTRQDVIGFNSEDITDTFIGPLLASEMMWPGTWRMGTGYYGLHDPTAYEIASNRTYLIASVWGYNRNIDPKNIRMPEVSLACLSSWAPRSPALPDPPINATTSGSSSIYSTTTSSAGSTSTQKLVAAAFAATAIPLLGSGV